MESVRRILTKSVVTSAELLMAGLNAFDVEMETERLKRQKSPVCIKYQQK
jgi:hypothetical protein